MRSMELHKAIRKAYTGKMRQIDLAERIGVTQGKVSRWSVGQSEPSLDELADIEDACELPRGWILRTAGLVANPVDVREALLADPLLPDELRGFVVDAYDAAVRRGGDGSH